MVYRIFQRFYDDFKQNYRNYQEKYDFFREVIERTVGKYLQCGILKHGFFRIHCPKCGNEYFLAFSCKSRICPSCNKSRGLRAKAGVPEIE
ncbi:MAG: hypothetical protein A2096_07025 [Spirochaetes bacterium GWF1_41_5]|nr:MAG: hypothetical protein A2096_07025 [Spirochaetes bacterium GWF1_41_5]HBE02596.1 hypothetical protein [Spirochaetia bacterium]